MEVKLNPADVKRLDNAIKEMMAVTKKELPKVLKNLTKDFLFLALADTPIAKKVTVIPLYKNGKQVLNASGKKIFVRTKARYPRGRGFAKACWIKGFQAVGVNPKNNWHQKSKKEAANNSDAINKLSASESPSIQVSNLNPYIEDLEKREKFCANAFRKTIDKTEAILTKMAIKTSKKWK